jgi:radical SAM/Cys-rich protein
MKSLNARNHELSDPLFQLKVLTKRESSGPNAEFFQNYLNRHGPGSLQTNPFEIFQMNLGYMCNQVCKHCHVDAGPDRKEIMSLDTMKKCLKIIKDYNFTTVDLTGGAPEMNPNFFWFVEELQKLKVHIIVRCNLTIIVANKKYNVLPEFFAKNRVEVVSSLPHFTAKRTDNQRGKGVFDDSIRALKMLNSVGYGREGSQLKLNLVFNPVGAFLPGNQIELEELYKERLNQDFGIFFNSLFVITNMPISRFLDYLIESGNYEDYMRKLMAAFNPAALQNVMCKNTLSIGWDGFIYDCDFNQMLGLKINGNSQHIDDFDSMEINNRDIVTANHCFGCTAGSGSSCGGQIT